MRRPREFEFGSETYRAARLSAWEQWDALLILKPALEDLETRTRPKRGRGAPPALDPMTAFTAAVNAIEPEALAGLLDLALSGVERAVEGDWDLIWDRAAGTARFDDLGAGRVILLVVRVLWENLHGYFAHKPVAFDRTGPEPGYEPVQMPDGRSWLLAPVERRLCLYESLLDGTLDLRDVAHMNDLIAVSAENQARARKAAEAAANQGRP